MHWKNDSKFHTVADGSKIHYFLNFSIQDLKPHDIVLVFNYGLVCNIEHYRYQIDFFHEQGYKILLHDYRCHFESQSDAGITSCTFKNITSDINSLLTELSIDHTIMFGHSMGVNVTLEFAKSYPEKLNGMILISGTVFPPGDVMFDSNIVDISEPYIHQTRNLLGSLFDSIWKTQYRNPLARLVVWQGGFNMKKTKIDFVEHYMKKIGELPVDLFFHLLKEMKHHSIINDLENISTKALIIGGDKDKIIPNYLQRILKKYLRNSELYIVKDGSHVPQIDFPESINQRSELFIKKLL